MLDVFRELSDIYFETGRNNQWGNMWTKRKKRRELKQQGK